MSENFLLFFAGLVAAHYFLIRSRLRGDPSFEGYKSDLVKMHSWLPLAAIVIFAFSKVMLTGFNPDDAVISLDVRAEMTLAVLTFCLLLLASLLTFRSYAKIRDKATQAFLDAPYRRRVIPIPFLERLIRKKSVLTDIRGSLLGVFVISSFFPFVKITVLSVMIMMSAAMSNLMFMGPMQVDNLINAGLIKKTKTGFEYVLQFKRGPDETHQSFMNVICEEGKDAVPTMLMFGTLVVNEHTQKTLNGVCEAVNRPTGVDV